VIAGSNPASPTSRVKISITINEKLAKEIDNYL